MHDQQKSSFMPDLLTAREARPMDTTELTVSELALALKRSLEEQFGYVRVRGEISGYRGPHSSGHAYFGLKDEAARIDAVIWRSAVSRLRTKLEEGLEVIAYGKLTTFPSKSTYQIVVESLEPAGLGALMTLLDTRRLKLAAEGIFDTSRKRALPFLPRVIGVVTSPTGSVIRDIIHRVSDRFPSRIIVWPARVQGDGSAEEIAAALRSMNALSAETVPPRPEVIIVARGGGSLEDLWSFNDEDVVRAAAESEIPIVSAVGHETDWTLLDYVADVRAPTPTAAAEICVPVRADLIYRISQAEGRCMRAVARIGTQSRNDLRLIERALPPISTVLSNFDQRCDNLIDTLRARVRSSINLRTILVSSHAGGLSRFSPIALLMARRQRLQITSGKLALALQRCANNADLQMRDRISAFRYLTRRCIAPHRHRLELFTGQWEAKRSEALRVANTLRGELERRAWALKRAVGNSHSQRSALNSRHAQLFSVVNYKAVLARGFALVFDGDGVALARAEQARASQKISIRFADGELAASVGSGLPRKRARSAAVGHEQKSLF